MMTNIERLGVNWPMQSLDVLEKSHNTILERHGVDNISQLQETKDKVKEYLPIPEVFILYPLIFITFWMMGNENIPVEKILELQ